MRGEVWNVSVMILAKDEKRANDSGVDVIARS